MRGWMVAYNWSSHVNYLNYDIKLYLYRIRPIYQYGYIVIEQLLIIKRDLKKKRKEAYVLTILYGR